MNAAQKADMDKIFTGVNGAGVLDYVSAWYVKAAQYMQQYNVPAIETGSFTKAAFVRPIPFRKVNRLEFYGVSYSTNTK
jgi:hypothetical protein